MVITLAKGDDSRLIEPRRFLIRDPQAFAAIWSAHAGADSSAPTVDFDEHMVAAVFAGERPTPGYAVAITGTRREAGGLVIGVEESSPDPSMIAAQVLRSPYHIALLPRDDGEIRFDAPDPTGQGTIVFKPQKRAMPRSSTAGADEPTRATGRRSPDQDRAARSSTGLSPEMAATMAYLAGPFSGALMLASEPDNRFVRFHAWQAVLGLGVLLAAAFAFLLLAFAFLLFSPTAFWGMLWLSAITAAAWLVAWVLCVVQAYRGRVWKLPLAGAFAERRVA